MTDVASLCRCDGYGLVVDAAGIITKCPDCNGKRLSNAEVKAIRAGRIDNERLRSERIGIALEGSDAY